MTVVAKKLPPDGGWGWMVVLGSAIACLVNVPFLQLFGLLYGRHLEQLGANTKSAALVGSVMLFVLNFGGPITGSYIRKTSPRIAAATGCCLVSSGVLLSGMTTAIWQMLPTYGLLVGFGIGLVQTSTFVAVNSYFKLKRSRAVGIAVAGSGMGQLLMPHLVRYLQDTYGFQGACLILAGVSLHGLLGCTLLHPVKWHMVTVESEVEEKEQLFNVQYDEKKADNSLKEEDKNTNNILVNNNGNHNCKELHKRDQYESLPSSDSVDSKNKEEVKIIPNVFQKVLDYFGFRLFGNFRLVNTIIGIALGVASLQNFSLFYPFFLKNSVGFDSKNTADCMSAIAAADLIGRLTLPSLVDKFKISAKISMVATSFWLLVTRQYLATQTTLATLIIGSVLFGMGRSMFIVSQNIAISDTVKPDEVPSAIGLGMMMKGFWVLPVTMFMGWLRDYTGSYVLVMYAQNVLIVLLLITWIPEIMYFRYKEKKQKQEDPERR